MTYDGLVFTCLRRSCIITVGAEASFRARDSASDVYLIIRQVSLFLLSSNTHLLSLTTVRGYAFFIYHHGKPIHQSPHHSRPP